MISICLRSVLCILVPVCPLLAASTLVEVERFRSPIDQTNPQLNYAHGIDFDTTSDTFWAAVNSPRTVWSFQADGEVSQRWSIVPDDANVLSVASDPSNDRVFRYQTPIRRGVYSSTPGGVLLDTISVPEGFVPRARLDYDPTHDLVIMPFIDFNDGSNSGFLEIPADGNGGFTNQLFDFVGARAVGSLLGFSLTEDYYWLLHDQGFQTDRVLTRIDRPDFERAVTFQLPAPSPNLDGPAHAIGYYGLAIDEETDIIYTQDRGAGDVVGLVVVPEPASAMLLGLFTLGAFCLRQR